jgi:protein CpxP
MEERKAMMKERGMKHDRKMMAKPQSGTSI